MASKLQPTTNWRMEYKGPGDGPTEVSSDTNFVMVQNDTMLLVIAPEKVEIKINVSVHPSLPSVHIMT